VLLDIRDRQEYRKSHIKEAINFPFEEFSVRKKDLEVYKKSDVAIICNAGTKSAQATVRFTKVYGFTNSVKNVKGGMQEWILRGYPIQQTKGL